MNSCDLTNLLWLLVDASPLALLIIYLMFGVLFGKDYLLGTPKNDTQRFDQVQNVLLVLSGLSLTAIALFSALYPEALIKIRSTLLYLSWAFVGFVVAAYLTNFRQRRLFLYTSEIIEWAGLLSIGVGFLSFFRTQVPSASELVYVYLVYVLTIVIIAMANLWFYIRFWKPEKKEVK